MPLNKLPFKGFGCPTDDPGCDRTSRGGHGAPLRNGLPALRWAAAREEAVDAPRPVLASEPTPKPAARPH